VWCRHEEANRLKSFTEVLDDGTTIEIVDGGPTAPVYVNEARVGSLLRRGLSWRFESAANGFTAKGGAAGFTLEGARARTSCAPCTRADVSIAAAT
jgi:hypothetical protein